MQTSLLSWSEAKLRKARRHSSGKLSELAVRETLACGVVYLDRRKKVRSHLKVHMYNYVSSINTLPKYYSIVITAVSITMNGPCDASSRVYPVAFLKRGSMYNQLTGLVCCMPK